MGEEAMLAGLADFVTTWRNGVETPDGLDFPLIEDLLESLRPHAPDTAAFDAFASDWILGTALPSLEVRESAVETDGDGYRVTGILANSGTGFADVRLRIEAAEPDGEEPAAFEDMIVAVTAGAESPFELRVPFEPARLVVDPDVELLFAGRRRTETALATP
jgi:hypothetical protein